MTSCRGAARRQGGGLRLRRGLCAASRLFAAAQIAALHPGRDFDICLCSAEDRCVPVPSLAHHGVRHLPRGDRRRRSPGCGSTRAAPRPSICGLRCRPPSPGQYRRLLYLDADVFVQGGDFAALLGIDIGGACARRRCATTLQWRTPGRRPESFRRLGLAACALFQQRGAADRRRPPSTARTCWTRCLEFARRASGRADPASTRS